MTKDAPGKGTLSVVVIGEGYALSWPCGITAEVDRIVEHRDDITAEVTINSTRPPRGGMLSRSKLNLVSTVSRRSLAKALEDRDPDLAWDLVIEALCFLVMEEYRKGEPAVDMRTFEPSPNAHTWVVEPYVQASGGTILFADGGSGKSFIALGICMSYVTGSPIVGQPRTIPAPVLYLDWETDADTFKHRYNAVLQGAGDQDKPPVHYKRMHASLPETASDVRREIARNHVGLVVIDSLGLARGGEPESADMTIRLFNAARSFRVPWLGIDHVTKAQGNEATKPFGSVYTHNAARLTWGVAKSQEEGSPEMNVALRSPKHNDWRHLPTRGLRISFQEDESFLMSVRFEPTDPAAVPELLQGLSLRKRILHALRKGPLTHTDLADQAGDDLKAVRSRAGEMAQKGELVRLDDPPRFALLRMEN